MGIVKSADAKTHSSANGAEMYLKTAMEGEDLGQQVGHLFNTFYSLPIMFFLCVDSVQWNPQSSRQ